MRFNGENEELRELFKVPEIDDMIRIENPTSYRLITENNFKNFSEPTTNALRWEENGFINYKINTRFGEFNIPLSSDREFKVLIDLLNKPTGGFNEINSNVLNDHLNSAYVWYKVVLPNGDWIITPNTPSSGNSSAIRNSLENTINLYEKSIEEALNEGVKQKLISEETKKQFQKSKQINSQYSGIKLVDSSTIDFDHPEGTIDEIRQWFSEWANNTVANKIDRRTENVIARGIQYRNVA